MSLFTELKRRNVIRVAIAYLAAAWLLIQIIETTFPVFGLADTSIRLTIILLAIGFPVAVLISWAYELTPGGLKLERNIDPAASDTQHNSKKLDRIIIIVLALAIGYFSYDKFVLDPARDATREQEVAEQTRSDVLVESYGDSSIAVLPFVNMSDDPDNEYFSDGISEELLNLLAKISRLRVISRSSSFSYKGKDIDIPIVAKELNVANVLEGSVRKQGNRVRITAQLIEARSDTHLWSETYDRDLDDIFAVQDEIAAAIVAQLKTTMGLDLVAPSPSISTANSAAHDAYLRGRYLIAQRTPESVKAAVSEFKNAVALDPDYALAYAELSLATRRASMDNPAMSRAEGIALATPYAERAMALDPTLAQAHTATGWLFRTPGNSKIALMHMQRAVELDPNYSEAHLWAGMLLGELGEYREYFAMQQRATQLDPLSRPAVANLIAALIHRDKLVEANQRLLSLAKIMPEYSAILTVTRESLNGHWADGLLAGLENLRIDNASVYENSMAERFAIIGLENEALATPTYLRSAVFAYSNKSAEAIVVAEEELAAMPDYWMHYALAQANAGQYARARDGLERWWGQSVHRVTSGFFSVDIAMALMAARREAGDEAGVAEMEAAINDNVRRYREAGIVRGDMFWSPDYEYGIVDLLAGETDAAMQSIAKAVDEGYYINPNAPYLQVLYEQPGFAAILAAQQAQQKRERDEFLEVVCHDNPYADVWQPQAGTCNEYLAEDDSRPDGP